MTFEDTCDGTFGDAYICIQLSPFLSMLFMVVMERLELDLFTI